MEELLELPDPDLADWLTGRQPIPPEVDSSDAAADAGTRAGKVNAPAAPSPRTAVPVWGAPRAGTPSCSPAAGPSSPAPSLHVTRDDARMARLAEALAFVAPEAEVLRFPAWDCLPYDRVSPNPALVSERIATLARLLEPPARPPHRADHGERAGAARAAARRVRRRQPGTDDRRRRSSRRSWRSFLEANGYGRAGTVMEPGEYAMRGGIVDIFPAGEADPVRLDLFGDTIEIDPHLRSRHPAQRRTARQRPDAAPGLRGAARQGRPSPASAPAGASCSARTRPTDPIYLSISDGRRHPGMEHWVPLFHEPHGDAARLPARRLGQPRPPGRRGADGAAGDDRRPLRRARRPCRATARCRTARCRPTLLYLDRAGWDAMLAGGPAVRLLARSRKPDGAVGVDGGGRPGPVFVQGAAAARRRQRVRPARGPGGALDRRGPPHRRRRLDPRLARAARQPAARARLQGRRAGGRLGRGRGASPPGRLAGHARRRARLRRRPSLRAGRRAGPAGRAHLPPAAPAQARRPVHRRGHRNRRGRPGRAPGIRHRPLRRAGRR